MYRKELDAYIENHKDEILEDVKKLVRIDSTRGKESPDMPYGPGCGKVLDTARELMEHYGLQTKNYGNRLVTGDFNDKEKQLDILAHLDVVPVTGDWTVTNPFDPIVTDGKIYGRGTSDDKGPAVAALHALKAIKDLGIELDTNVRLILGSDEECGSSDLAYYYEREKEAPMSFTPDAEYPVINIEKGHFAKKFEANFKETPDLPRICSIAGGDKVNVVPANASARIEGLDEKIVQETADKVQEQTKVKFTVSRENEKLLLCAKGVAGHASTPEVGNNALTALLQLLSVLPFPKTEGVCLIQALSLLFPHNDFDGYGMGIAMEDEISGKLTMNLGVLSLENGVIEGHFDSRVPICGTEKTVTQAAKSKMKEAGFAMEDTPMIPPHHVPADSELVTALLETYEDYMGKKGKPLAIGGGTYVHELERGVAFGCMVPEVDNHMHGDDEFMMVDMLMKSTKMFADVIVKLCKH